MHFYRFFLAALSSSALILSSCAFDEASNTDNANLQTENTNIGSKEKLPATLITNIEPQLSTTAVELTINSGVLKVGMNDELSSTTLSLNALTAVFTIDGTLPYSLHNVGTDAQNYPAAISVEDREALIVEVNTFDAFVDGGKNTIYIQNDFEFSMEVTNLNGAFSSDIFFNAENPHDQRLTGTVSITIPAGTQLLVKKPGENDSYTEITKIESGGPMSIQGSSFFSFNEAITVGECFIWEDDYLGFGSGFERVTCPI